MTALADRHIVADLARSIPVDYWPGSDELYCWVCKQIGPPDRSRRVDVTWHTVDCPWVRARAQHHPKQANAKSKARR